QARAEEGPSGTYTADDPTLQFEGTYDVIISEDSYGPYLGRYWRQMSIGFWSKPTITNDPKYGLMRSEGAYVLSILSADSATAIPPPFAVGRYDGIDMYDESVGESCTATGGFGVGGGGSYPPRHGNTIITTRNAEIIEGSIEVPGSNGKVA